MRRLAFLNRSSLRATLLLGVALLQPSLAQPAGSGSTGPLSPIPPVRSSSAVPALPPGQVQPLAPGTRKAPSLPELAISPPVPELAHLQYRGNGFIEVAGGVLLLPENQTNLARIRTLALQVVERAFAARPGLSEVDVSAYRAQGYGGFGGPPPLFTASVPRTRLADFERYASGQGSYDRVYEGRTSQGGPPPQPPAPPLHAREQQPIFHGSSSELLKQQVTQSVSQFRGGVRGSLFFKGSPRARVAALTFDDAPHPIYEPLVLDLLRRAGIHATFFVIGRNAEVYPYFIRDMVAAGHEVGNHTYHHVRLPGLPEATVRAELEQTNAAITRITGQPVRYFRPPGGDYSPLTLRVAASLGLTTTFWTDDPGDFTNAPDVVIRTRLEARLRPGGIVLLHDNAPDAIDVLQTFLHVARQRDTVLDTVGVLARVAVQTR